MKHHGPDRLKQSQEFGELLRAADPVNVSAERLAKSAEAVRQMVVGTTPAVTFPWWKSGLPLLVLVGIVGFLLIRGARDAPRATMPQTERATPAVPAILDAGAVEPADAAEPDVAVDAARVEEPVDASPRVLREPPRRRPEQPPALAAAEVQAPASVPVDAGSEATASDLPEQIRLYEEARAAEQRREYERGIRLLDELLRRFPRSPLRADAELTRAELLTHADRPSEAVRALERLTAAASHRGRRGELLRALGDLYRKQGDCARALEAYTGALAEKLNQRERRKVDHGVERCRAVQP
jgi:tetratricopeptide (TPR) repeat protein